MNLKVYHNPGEIISKGEKKDLMYLDQLDKDINYIGCYKFPKYVRTKYNISLEEYYNLVVFNDINKEHICRNKNCNNKLKFRSLLGPAYKECCSRKCNGEYVSNILKLEGRLFMNSPKFRELSINKIKELFNDGTHPFRSVEVHARSRKTDFINKSVKHGRTLAYLYWSSCKDESIFKIGVTCDIENYNGLMDLHGYTSINKLKEGDISYIADLEYKIKLHFNKRTEYYKIEEFDIVINYIKSII